MFEQLKLIPKDPILGLVEQFNQDTRLDKVNLTVGVYYNEKGKPGVFEAVRTAEKNIVERGLDKTYLPIKGSPAYLTKIAQHLLGDVSEEVVASYGSGGTGSLRLAAEVIRMSNPHQRIWISTPTWEAHNTLFKHCNFEVLPYPWIDENNQFTFDAFLAELEEHSKPNDWVLLHGCCHNPTGLDPSFDQWMKLFKFMQERELKPLIDIAYHGFAENLEQDAAPVRAAVKMFNEIVICYSLSKAMGLYNDRCGAMMIKASATPKDILDSNIQRMGRLLFSNPPAFGVRIVEQIMNQDDLYQMWVKEVGVYRERLHSVRKGLSNQLKTLGDRFSHIAKGRGLFALTGLNAAQIEELKATHGIYLVGNSRINIAGLNESNIDRVADAIKKVI